MTSVNIREFSHNMSKYMKKVKNGEHIVLKERNIPVADIFPHNENIERPGWKREVKRIRLKNGGSLSDAVMKDRLEQRL